MKTETFEEFLRKKKREPEDDWAEKEQQWISAVTNFYNDVKKWLEPFVKKGLLVIREDSFVNTYEDGSDDYEIKKLDIIIGKTNIITLKPRGSLLVGGYGRIDMSGPQGVISIIQKKDNKWKFKNMVTLEELWEVNERSFESVIQDLVNG